MSRRRNILLSCLTILSFISGYLMSKVSITGRAGMSLFYRQYNFLKVWWKGTLMIFFALIFLFLLQGQLQKRLSRKNAVMAQVVACLVAFAGLYFTYYDFRHTLSHHLLGERFHLGVYLFWLGWISISIFYLVQKNTLTPTSTETPLDPPV